MLPPNVANTRTKNPTLKLVKCLLQRNTNAIPEPKNRKRNVRPGVMAGIDAKMTEKRSKEESHKNTTLSQDIEKVIWRQLTSPIADHVIGQPVFGRSVTQ